MKTLLMKNIKKIMLVISVVTIAVILGNQVMVMALSDGDTDLVKSIVGSNQELFNQSSLIGDLFRFIGIMLLKGLAWLASSCATLYDNTFGLVDFTQYGPVKDFLEKWQVVWVVLLSASIGMLGLMLAFFWDKRPKVVINLLVGVLVVTSMGWMISKMNTLISTDVRNEIMGTSSSSDAIYDSLGDCIHDLIYLDSTVGLTHLNEKNSEGGKNSELTYSKFTKKQLAGLSINEKVEPDDVKDESSVIVENKLTYFYGTDADGNSKSYTFVEEIYDGVAWTNLLSEYYYRYKIDWFIAYLQMFSLIIIYLFFSYKVVRTIYEIVWSELLAMLYSPNLAGGQKILKILDSIKDSYIILLLSVVSVKMYLIAVNFVSGMSNWDGFTKAMVLVFIAFAVIDGPHLVQKLTGQDVGLSDGLQKIMSTMYGTSATMGVLRMGAGAVRGAGHLAGKAAGTIKGGADKVASSTAKEGLNQQAKEAADNQNPDDAALGKDAGAEFNNNNELNNENQSHSENDRNSEQNNDTSSNQDNGASGSFDDGRNSDVNAGADAAMDIPEGNAKSEALSGMDPIGGASNNNSNTDDMDRAIDGARDNIYSSSGKNDRGPIDTNSGMFRNNYGNRQHRNNGNINNRNNFTNRAYDFDALEKRLTSKRDETDTTSNRALVNNSNDRKNTFENSGKDKQE